MLYVFSLDQSDRTILVTPGNALADVLRAVSQLQETLNLH